MTAGPDTHEVAAVTACTGTWHRASYIGESEPYIRVMHCDGCTDRMVIDGARLAFMETDPTTTDEQIARRVFTERPR